MAKISKSLVVPYTPEQMYNLINDIELYPEFLPWCVAAKIHSRDTNKLQASIHLSKGPVKHGITTENTMNPYERIIMRYIAGPFKHCTGSWEFVARPGGKECEILFNMDYEFTNKLVSLAIEPVFSPIANTLIEAFYARAKKVYS